MVWILMMLACGGSPETPEAAPAPADEAAAEPEAKPEAPKEKPAEKKSQDVVDADCNASLQSLGFKEGEVVKIKCADGCTSGSVYGTDVYTADSKVCTAGVHAGAIPAEGGKFKAKIDGKLPNFKGSSQNGIDSKDWNSEWGPTFRVQARAKKK